MTYKKIESDADINILVAMAHEIWSSHFKTMFDNETLPKLIEAAQSRKAILAEIEDGCQYSFIEHDGEKIGYFACKTDQLKKELFLSKIYLYSNQRGNGVGKQVLHHLEELCHNGGLDKITLTVYHENVLSIKTYEKWGFSNLGFITREFDDGLVFEDIQMEKDV